MRGDFGLTNMTMAVLRAIHRDHIRQQKYELKIKALELGESEIQQHIEYMFAIISLHKKCSPNINWDVLANMKSPILPLKTKDAEIAAVNLKEKYHPGFWIKLLNLTQHNINKLQANVERAKI